MQVKLLQDVMETDKDGKEVALKVTRRKGRPTIPFVKDAVVDMSDASAQKYIDRGWAEAYKKEMQELNEEQEQPDESTPTDSSPGDSQQAAAAHSAKDGGVSRR